MEEDRRIRVLIVDDEPYIGDLLERYLRPEGYNCRVVRSGKEALTELTSTQIHLVLVDIIMPGMSGMDLLAIIKTLYPDVAVIMVTGVDDRDTGVLAVDLGAYGYVVKPFERNEILISVASAIERRRLALLARESKGVKTSTAEQVTVRRSPIQVSARKVLDLIDSGMDEPALMGELKLFPKAFHSLMDQLVAVGRLRAIGSWRKNPLSPGSVVVDLDQAKFPEITKKSRLSAQLMLPDA